MEEIQKSIQLINFSDSIFDSNNNETDKNDTNSTHKHSLRMLKQTAEQVPAALKQQIPIEELFRIYFKEKDEIVKEILVVYGPLFKEFNFIEAVQRHEKLQKSVEMNCFGTLLTGRQDDDILNFYYKMFPSASGGVTNEINVLCKWIKNRINLRSEGRFDAKTISKTLALMEATEFAQLNAKEFYSERCRVTTITISRFIDLFNKFTNFLISEILICETKIERRVVVKRILKLGKEFAVIGAMNNLKSCLAALECNSVHRLRVIKDQSSKYQERFKKLSKLTSSDNNFGVLREMGCLIPWLGIILKDFTFIREVGISDKRDLVVNVPLALCLRKLMKSIGGARESCEEVIKLSTLKEKSDAAVMLKWLNECCEIVYDGEEAQYRRSLEIKGEEYF